MDGMWEPPASPSAQEQAERHGASKPSRTLVSRHAKMAGARFELVDDGEHVNLFAVRGVHTGTNDTGPATTENPGDRAEFAHNRAHSDRINAFWRAQESK
jgi:hypothetical protein